VNSIDASIPCYFLAPVAVLGASAFAGAGLLSDELLSDLDSTFGSLCPACEGSTFGMSTGTVRGLISGGFSGAGGLLSLLDGLASFRASRVTVGRGSTVGISAGLTRGRLDGGCTAGPLLVGGCGGACPVPDGRLGIG